METNSKRPVQNISSLPHFQVKERPRPVNFSDTFSNHIWVRYIKILVINWKMCNQSKIENI